MSKVTIFKASPDLAGLYVTGKDAIDEMEREQPIEAFAGGLQLVAGFNEYLKFLPELATKSAGAVAALINVSENAQDLLDQKESGAGIDNAQALAFAGDFAAAMAGLAVIAEVALVGVAATTGVVISAPILATIAVIGGVASTGIGLYSLYLEPEGGEKGWISELAENVLYTTNSWMDSFSSFFLAEDYGDIKSQSYTMSVIELMGIISPTLSDENLEVFFKLQLIN